MGKNNCNSITIAKAIGIILMVIGHSGCPQGLSKIIYLFHMPLFFFCSGIFFCEMNDYNKIKTFLKKRIKGLYFPFIKWSLFFLLLHNLFMSIGIYNSYYGYEGGSSYYTASDLVDKLFAILFTMHGYEELLGGFWFIRALFITSLLIVVFSLLLRKYFKYKKELLCMLFFVLTVLIRRIFPDPEFWRDISMGTLGAFFYMSGNLLMQYKNYWQNKLGALLCCLVLFLSYFYFKETVSMGCGYNKVFFYSVSAVAGILLTLDISIVINSSYSVLKRPLYYIGNHTLEILALHFLTFRILSYFYIKVTDMDIIHIAEHPVMTSVYTPSFIWALYSIIGIGMPIMFVLLYQYFGSSFKKKFL